MWKPGQIITIDRGYFIFTLRVVHTNKITDTWGKKVEEITTNHLRRCNRNVDENLPDDCILQSIKVRTRNNIPKEVMG